MSYSEGEWNNIDSGLFISSHWIALIVIGLGEKPNKAEGISFPFFFPYVWKVKK